MLPYLSSLVPPEFHLSKKLILVTAPPKGTCPRNLCEIPGGTKLDKHGNAKNWDQATNLIWRCGHEVDKPSYGCHSGVLLCDHWSYLVSWLPKFLRWPSDVCDIHLMATELACFSLKLKVERKQKFEPKSWCSLWHPLGGYWKCLFFWLPKFLRFKKQPKVVSAPKVWSTQTSFRDIFGNFSSNRCPKFWQQ